MNSDRGELFSALRRSEATYMPADSLRQALSRKSLVMLVGPSAIGKSTIMNTAVQCDPRFARVSGFTSRSARPNDEPRLYRYIASNDDFAKLESDIHQHQLIQYAVSPVKDVIYGTALNDYPGEFNMIDTFYSAVEQYRTLGFKDVHTIALVADADEWRTWFQNRWQRGAPEVASRLQEARQSLEWSVAHQDTLIFIQNKAGEQERVARELIGVSLDQKVHQQLNATLAKNMLGAIDAMESDYR